MNLQKAEVGGSVTVMNKRSTVSGRNWSAPCGALLLPCVPAEYHLRVLCVMVGRK